MVFSSLCLLLPKAYSYDDGDFQVWITEAEEFKINDVSKITIEEEQRFGDDASEFYYQHYDGGFTYDVNKHFVVSLNYRQIYAKAKTHSKFKEENQPYAYVTAKCDLRGFKLEDRNRFEYRHFDYQGDSWRYRNKFTVKLPWKFSAFEIQPYLADEIFLDLNGIDFNRNRYSCGCGFTIIKNLKGELFYLLQSAKSNGGWAQTNVLGTKIKISF